MCYIRGFGILGFWGFRALRDEGLVLRALEAEGFNPELGFTV